MAPDEDERDLPPSASISKEGDGRQDSRATARLGEDPDQPSTRVETGRGVVEAVVEHERKIQHKDLTDEEVAAFEHPERRGKKG